MLQNNSAYEVTKRFNKSKDILKFEFKVSNTIRISCLKKAEENFTISERISRDPPVYKLLDYDKEIKACFMNPRLSLDSVKSVRENLVCQDPELKSLSAEVSGVA